MALGRVPNETPLVDSRTGRITDVWMKWFQNFRTTATGSSGASAVTGPSSSTDNAIARFNGANGSVIQNSLATINDSGSIAIPVLQTVDGRDPSVDGLALDTVVAAEAAHESDTSNPHAVAIGQVIGGIKAFETSAGNAILASGGEVILLNSTGSQTWKIRGAYLSGDGKNFDAAGDRNLSITDNTSTWSVIPAATLKALAAARWGDAGLPFPATVSHFTAASGAGVDIVAKYSGGTTDYIDGDCTIVLLAERTA